MKRSAPIAGRPVSSNATFIVFSHARGLLTEQSDFHKAKEFWDREIARHVERGQDTDALLFEWSNGGWKMVGNLYDLEHPGPVRQVSLD